MLQPHGVALCKHWSLSFSHAQELYLHSLERFIYKFAKSNHEKSIYLNRVLIIYIGLLWKVTI